MTAPTGQPEPLALPRSALHDLVLKIAAVVIATAITGGTAALWSLASGMAVLQDQMARVEQRLEGVYMREDAERDLGQIRARLGEHEQRLDRLERGE